VTITITDLETQEPIPHRGSPESAGHTAALRARATGHPVRLEGLGAPRTYLPQLVGRRGGRAFRVPCAQPGCSNLMAPESRTCNQCRLAALRKSHSA